MMGKIRDLPTSERPRERLMKYGTRALSDSELLAIILRTGTRHENVVLLCQEILRNISELLWARGRVAEGACDQPPIPEGLGRRDGILPGLLAITLSRAELAKLPMPTCEIRPGCTPALIDEVIQSLASRRWEALGDLRRKGWVQHLQCEGASGLLEALPAHFQAPEFGDDAKLARIQILECIQEASHTEPTAESFLRFACISMWSACAVR